MYCNICDRLLTRSEIDELEETCYDCYEDLEDKVEEFGGLYEYAN